MESKYIWVVMFGLILVLTMVMTGSEITRVTTAVSDVSPFVGAVDKGYVKWNQDTIRVAWKGEYNENDVSIIEECFFELEQATGKKFIVVDPIRGNPEMLITFDSAADMGFPWEDNWAGLTNIGWYPNGSIAPGVMVYINVEMCNIGGERENCIKHEIGHAVGLGHINDKVSIMNAGITGHSEYSPVDMKYLHMIYNK